MALLAMAGFQPDEIVALDPTAITAFVCDQFRELPPLEMDGLDAIHVGHLTHDDIAVFSLARLWVTKMKL